MKGVISDRLRKILNDPELRVKFFKEYFGVGFINPPRPSSNKKVEKVKKRKRNLLDLLFGA